MRPDVLTEFGLRTLSSEHPQFAPEAYHRGAAWPFDSWLGWGGLRACRARRPRPSGCAQGVLAALQTLGDAPELYAVTDDGPRRIPIANRVQAWTIGAQFALRAQLGRTAEAVTSCRCCQPFSAPAVEPGHDPLLEDHHEHDQRHRDRHRSRR